MKHFYIYLLSIAAILLIVGAGAAVIPILQHERVPDNKRLGTLRHLDQMRQTNYDSSRRSARYATIATQEEQSQAATLLRAISKAEAIQCENCRRALKVLGGDATPDAPARIEQHTTAQHLSTLIEERIRFRTTRTSLFVRYAAEQSNIYVARLITWCDQSDLSQIGFLRRELSRIDSTSQPLPHTYYVCPRCSNISDDEFVSHFCPYCMTPFADFFIFD